MTDDFAGWADDVPVLLGVTEDEARFFVQPTRLYAHPEVRPEDAYTIDILTQTARAPGGPHSDEIMQHFSGAGATPYEAIAQLITAGAGISRPPRR